VSATALHTNLAIAAPGYTGPEPPGPPVPPPMDRFMNRFTWLKKSPVFRIQQSTSEEKGPWHLYHRQSEAFCSVYQSCSQNTLHTRYGQKKF